MFAKKLVGTVLGLAFLGIVGAGVWFGPAIVRADPAAKGKAGDLRIEVTGRQWFWDVDYPDQHFRTANELHIPVGEQVSVGLRTDDMIHSFWVPQLNRKVDMIPGQHNVLRFTPRTPGTYVGECAEFCGLEHARMGFAVVVQSDLVTDKYYRHFGRDLR